MTKAWISFSELFEIVSKEIGSKVLAIGEIKKLLRCGELRSAADRFDVHEPTGEIMRTYEHELEATWWNDENRFRRSSITGKMMLMFPGKLSQMLPNGVKFYNPHQYENIRFWYEDIARIFDIRKEQSSLSLQSNNNKKPNFHL